MGSNVTFAVVVGLYLLGMLGIGFYFSKKVRDSADFYTTKGTTNAPVTGFSYAATQMSAGTVVGSPGVTYNLGYNYLPGNFASTAAPWFTFLSIGERIRRISERINAYTYGDILSVRYGKNAKLIYALLILVFYIPLMVGQLKAAGDILSVILDVPYVTGMIISGIVIIVYTYGGGMFAVAWTDLMQGLVMMVGLIALAFACLGKVGGFSAMNAGLAAIDPNMIQMTGLVTGTWAFCNMITWSFLQIGGSAASVVRFIIPKDMKTLRHAFAYALVFSSTVFMSTAIIGPSGRLLIPGLQNSDLLVPTLTSQLLHPIFGGLILSAVLAAIMSTVDSVLLLCSAAATRDLYVTFVKPSATDEEQLALGKKVTIALGVICMLMAIKPFAAIQWLVAFSFNVLASGLTAPILLGVWWPRASKAAGVSGMITGTVVSLVWYGLGYAQYGSFSNWPFGIWPGVIGFAVSLVTMLIVTAFTPPPPKDVLDTFYIE